MQSILHFLLTIELIGIAIFPLGLVLFPRFLDKGWALSKILGIVIASYIVWLCSSLHILPFTRINALLILALLAVATWTWGYRHIRTLDMRAVIFIVIEEILFIVSFAIWNYLRGFAPDINGLEKYMDYGFMLSTLRAEYFPPLDHFLATETINYYYYGHYIAAFLTTLSNVAPQLVYNLQMSHLFALTIVLPFSIGSTLFSILVPTQKIPWRSGIAGLLAGLFVGVFGNLHAAFKYFFSDAPYWYPDATRYIENTIHEFPVYSFIVNDLHGHVSSIPVVFLVIAILFTYMLNQFTRRETIPTTLPHSQTEIRDLLRSLDLPLLLLLSGCIGMLYTINAWDLPIYLLLSGIVLLASNTVLLSQNQKERFTLFSPSIIIRTAIQSVILFVTSLAIFIPFWMHFHPISQGIGIVPFGEQSPIGQIAILWGIQVPIVVGYVLYILQDDLSSLLAKTKNSATTLLSRWNTPEYYPHIFLMGMVALSLLLIVLPEFVFIRDIYPTHYRANTMFKFYYQAWNMLGLTAGVGVVYVWYHANRTQKWLWNIYTLITVTLIIGAALYPFRAIKQGFGDLNNRRSINGIEYIQLYHNDDYEAIQWLNSNIDGYKTIVEAVGDSYTRYARVSSNTGLPTVLGWPVHEWLWRGSYSESLLPTTHVEQTTNTTDTVATRTAEVQELYETENQERAQELLSKYNVDYVYIGSLEREKYTDLSDEKFYSLGRKVYDNNNVQIYAVE